MEGQLSSWYMDSEALNLMFGELNLLPVGFFLSDSCLGPHVLSPRQTSDPTGSPVDIVRESYLFVPLPISQ